MFWWICLCAGCLCCIYCIACASGKLEKESGIMARLYSFRSGVVSGQPRGIEELETLPPLLSRPPMLRRGRRRSLAALRGWLLMPGHLELLIWIVGVCILLVLTAVLIWLFTVSWSYHLLQVKGMVT